MKRPPEFPTEGPPSSKDAFLAGWTAVVRSLLVRIIRLIEENSQHVTEQKRAHDLAVQLVEKFTEHSSQWPEKIITEEMEFSVNDLLSGAHGVDRFGFLRIFGDFSQTEFPDFTCIWIVLVKSPTHLSSFLLVADGGYALPPMGGNGVLLMNTKQFSGIRAALMHGVPDAFMVLANQQAIATEIHVMKAGIPTDRPTSAAQSSPWRTKQTSS